MKEFFPKEPKSWQARKQLNELNTKWLIERKVKAFYCLVEANNVPDGVFPLIQV